jgi:PAS domain S-box-containing protein
MTEGVMMVDSDLYNLLEHTTDAAFAVTDGGEICSWNTSAEALFGFRRDEVVGKTCFELFQGRDALCTLTCKESCHVRDSAAHHTPIPDFDLEVNTRDRGRIWVNMSTLVYEDPKSGRRRIVHMARNVWERKQTEAVVQRMLVVSKQLAEIAEHSLRPAPVGTLSEQENRVLRSFSEGKRPADIEHELKISAQTLRNHLHHINQKLGTHNRLEAVTHAIRRKLI